MRLKVGTATDRCEVLYVIMDRGPAKQGTERCSLTHFTRDVNKSGGFLTIDDIHTSRSSIATHFANARDEIKRSLNRMAFLDWVYFC